MKVLCMQEVSKIKGPYCHIIIIIISYNLGDRGGPSTIHYYLHSTYSTMTSINWCADNRRRRTTRSSNHSLCNWDCDWDVILARWVWKVANPQNHSSGVSKMILYPRSHLKYFRRRGKTTITYKGNNIVLPWFDLDILGTDIIPYSSSFFYQAPNEYRNSTFNLQLELQSTLNFSPGNSIFKSKS